MSSLLFVGLLSYIIHNTIPLIKLSMTILIKVLDNGDGLLERRFTLRELRNNRREFVE